MVGRATVAGTVDDEHRVPLLGEQARPPGAAIGRHRVVGRLTAATVNEDPRRCRTRVRRRLPFDKHGTAHHRAERPRHGLGADPECTPARSRDLAGRFKTSAHHRLLIHMMAVRSTGPSGRPEPNPERRTHALCSVIHDGQPLAVAIDGDRATPLRDVTEIGRQTPASLLREPPLDDGSLPLAHLRFRPVVPTRGRSSASGSTTSPTSRRPSATSPTTPSCSRSSPRAHRRL